jgi:hypothetical protein
LSSRASRCAGTHVRQTDEAARRKLWPRLPPGGNDIPLATRRRILNVSVAIRWVFELSDVGRYAAKHGLRWGGEALDAEYTVTAAFKKYDDGWRFEQFTSGVL